jgi:hypothetical protein
MWYANASNHKQIMVVSVKEENVLHGFWQENSLYNPVKNMEYCEKVRTENITTTTTTTTIKYAYGPWLSDCYQQQNQKHNKFNHLY